MEPTASDTSSSGDQSTEQESPSQNLPKAPTSWFGKLFAKKEEVKGETVSEEVKPVEVIPEVKESPKEIKVAESSSEVGKRKLNADQVMKLLFLIATFVDNTTIVRTIKKEFGISISKTTVKHYKTSEQYRGQIQKMRERWGSDLLDVELSNKRRRLEELEKIYKHCYANDQMKNALAAIHQIQGEIEKDLQNIGSQTNYQINIYKDMSESELEEERVKSLERLKALKQIPEIKEIKEIV